MCNALHPKISAEGAFASTRVVSQINILIGIESILIQNSKAPTVSKIESLSQVSGPTADPINEKIPPIIDMHISILQNPLCRKPPSEESGFECIRFSSLDSWESFFSVWL